MNGESPFRETVFPPPSTSRWGRMEGRVAHAAREAGVSLDGVDGFLRAHRAAMAVREWGENALPSDHHPAFLHPGRTVLILLGDFEETSPRLIAAAALAESRDLDLRVSPGEARQALGGEGGEGAFELWGNLPSIQWRGPVDGTEPDIDAALLEELVLAPSEVQRVAMAEALDHLRHAHLWESAEERRRAATLAREVFEPLSSRVHPTLERRLGWWLRRVSPGL